MTVVVVVVVGVALFVAVAGTDGTALVVPTADNLCTIMVIVLCSFPSMRMLLLFQRLLLLLLLLAIVDDAVVVRSVMMKKAKMARGHHIVVLSSRDGLASGVEQRIVCLI